MALSSRRGDNRDGRLVGVVPVCLFALLLVLAQPVAYAAWFGGEHVTLEQAELHDGAVGRGDLHHYGLGSKADPERTGARADSVADLHPSTTDLAPTANLTALSPDFMKSVLVEKVAPYAGRTSRATGPDR